MDFLVSQFVNSATATVWSNYIEFWLDWFNKKNNGLVVIEKLCKCHPNLLKYWYSGLAWNGIGRHSIVCNSFFRQHKPTVSSAVCMVQFLWVLIWFGFEICLVFGTYESVSVLYFQLLARKQMYPRNQQ